MKLPSGLEYQLINLKLKNKKPGIFSWKTSDTNRSIANRYICIQLNTVTTQALYESPIKRQNQKRYGTLSNQCICCCKPMKPGEKLHVHMNTDWLAVNPAISEKDCEAITGAPSQGCFPIGNCCAKKMTGFTFLSCNI
jgi:hypothetical protein